MQQQQANNAVVYFFNASQLDDQDSGNRDYKQNNE